jgi:heat shock protein HspQ
MRSEDPKSKPPRKRAAKIKPAAPKRLPVAAARSRARARGKDARVHRAKFAIGDVVRHLLYPFRGVIFDIDPIFNNTEEWWLSIPAHLRPRKDQPYYHLLAENEETEYIAYVSEQNLLPDDSGEPLRHPRLSEFFTEDESGHYRAHNRQAH